MTRVHFGNDDPRRWNADHEEERRWERNWEEGRRRDRELKAAQDAQREGDSTLRADLEAKLKAEGKRLDASIQSVQDDVDDLAAMMDATPNWTGTPKVGSADRELQLNGTRVLRGQREKVMPPPPEGEEQEVFTEWYEQVAFATPYPAPPVVTVTVEEFGPPPPGLTGVWNASVHGVGTAGFAFRVTTTPGVVQARVHWRAEGDT